MTRINLVSPNELCDQHLLAEHRELTRIPNTVYRRHVAGILDLTGQTERVYTVRTNRRPEGGQGHVKFFYNKMEFLFIRYLSLMRECRDRGFSIQDRWAPEVVQYLTEPSRGLYNDYEPTEEAILLNIERIIERTPANARWTSPGRVPPYQRDFAPFRQESALLSEWDI